MADKTFNQTTGAQDWATGSNWTPTGVPASGDRVFITKGDAALVVTAASTQAAVTLAELNVYDTFLGSLTVDAAATVERIGFPSGSQNGAAGSQRIVRNNGSVATTVIVYKTGASADATIGLGAYRWTGTATTNSITVLGGSVDIATDLSTAAVATLNVQAGNVTVGRNATTTAITQTGGTVLHTGLSASTGVLLVAGGTVTTTGATKFPTVTVNAGTANLNHRPASGDAAATVTVNSGGTVSLQGDPRAFSVTTGFYVLPGGTLSHFGLSQVTGGGLVVATPGKLTPSAGA